jgi:glycosyltransferase involved in cell wall biosynthesis
LFSKSLNQGTLLMHPIPTQPLASCITPTANRRRFVPQAIRYFLAQDYSNKELLVVDDGEEAVDDLVPEDEWIRYIRLPRKTVLGEKRNHAAAEARGEIIVHWDDDDWNAPWRLHYQVEELVARSGALHSRRPAAPGA